MTRIYLYAFILVSLIVAVSACKDDESFTTDANAKLAFSSDTLRFDTVFTQRGSAVRYIKIINNNDRPVRVSKIFLLNGAKVFKGFDFHGAGLCQNLWVQKMGKFEKRKFIFVISLLNLCACKCVVLTMLVYRQRCRQGKQII